MTIYDRGGVKHRRDWKRVGRGHGWMRAAQKTILAARKFN